MTSFEKSVKKIFEDIFQVKKSESILILCDKKTKIFAEKVYMYSTVYGKKVLCFEVPVLKNNGAEPDKKVSKLMCEFDIILLLTSKSMTHTKARKNANKNGSRIASCPGMDESMLKRTVDVDYDFMMDVEKRISKLMKKTKIVRITSKLGTDISFNIYNNKIVISKFLEKKGSYNNLPLGEVFVAPKENTANGIYIVDGSQAGVGLVDKPIKFIVKSGYVSKIQGGKSAAKLRKLLKSVNDKKAYNLAELGIGSNPKAKLTGKVLEDEKIFRTCHIALGNNIGFGGKINVPVHVDGVMTKPTVYFDDKIIMKDGNLLI